MALARLFVALPAFPFPFRLPISEDISLLMTLHYLYHLENALFAGGHLMSEFTTRTIAIPTNNEGLIHTALFLSWPCCLHWMFSSTFRIITLSDSSQRWGSTIRQHREPLCCFWSVSDFISSNTILDSLSNSTSLQAHRDGANWLSTSPDSGWRFPTIFSQMCEWDVYV